MDYLEIAKDVGHQPFIAQQKYTELAELLEMVHKIKPKKILELGVYKGGTIKAWTKIAESDATIVGIDLPQGQFGGGFSPEEAEGIKKLALDQQEIHLFALDSHLKSTVKKVEKFGLFDFMFIDADHTYEGVKKDFELYKGLVRSGGFIAFHDIVEHIHHPGVEVQKFWLEVKEQYPSENIFEFTDPDFPSDHNPWGGLGVIRI